MRVVAVGPHPDDAELGAGGLLYTVDDPTVLLVVGLDSTRVQEAECASAILGATLQIGPAIDGQAAASESLIRNLVQAFLIGADTLLIPPDGDTHQDHRACRFAAMSAARRWPGMILEYETPSAPVGWAPNMYFPIPAAAMRAAEDAIACHESQRHLPYMRRGLSTARAELHGVKIGVELAEGYRLVRGVLR